MNPAWHFLNGVPVVPVARIGTALAGDGSASAPAYAFQTEPTTGWYWPQSARLALSLGGTQSHLFGATFYALLSDSASIQLGASGDVAVSRGAANRLDVATGDSLYLVSGGIGAAHIETTSGSITATRWNTGGLAAAATTSQKIIKKVTGIADNTATAVLTVTVPNANHAAGILLSFVSSNGSTDAFESTRVAQGFVVLARTAGANVVPAAATLTLAQIATVSGGATHTLAYAVSAVTGAVGDPNTFTVNVTIDDSGNLGSNQVVVMAEIINAEATGVTIA